MGCRCALLGSRRLWYTCSLCSTLSCSEASSACLLQCARSRGGSCFVSPFLLTGWQQWFHTISPDADTQPGYQCRQHFGTH